MQLVDSSILSHLNRPQRQSHKGENGRILIIAGSDKYHGSLLLSVQSASRIADLIYIHSVEKNSKLIDKLRSEIATFINIDENDLWPTAGKMDVIMFGPGMDNSRQTKELTDTILKKFTNKKIVADATALRVLNPENLHENCIITPHMEEFESLFKCLATPQNVLKMAKQFNCVIVLKGVTDYISNGNLIYENQTGNAGMTKGGTGDVLAGLIGGLYVKNDALTAALAGTYLNGLAGDRLYEVKNTFYNAEDVIFELGKIWGEYFK